MLLHSKGRTISRSLLSIANLTGRSVTHLLSLFDC